jgi:hypothetical protein
MSRHFRYDSKGSKLSNKQKPKAVEKKFAPSALYYSHDMREKGIASVINTNFQKTIKKIQLSKQPKRTKIEAKNLIHFGSYDLEAPPQKEIT